MGPTRGKFFDLFIFFGNLFIVSFLCDLIRGGHDLSFAFLLILATLLHSIGALLKRAPLQLRLRQNPRSEMSGWGYLLFLVLFTMHYALFAACLSWGASFSNGGAGAKDSLAAFLTIGGALVPTIFSIRALLPAGEDSKPPAHGQEFLADTLIYISLIVIFAFWEGVFVETLAGKGEGSLFLTILLAVLTTVPFSMFYLAPRILFLIEDYRQPSTWGYAFIVMLPLSVRIMFG